MLSHPLAEEHPYVLADCPAEMLAAFWEDAAADASIVQSELLTAWEAVYQREVST